MIWSELMNNEHICYKIEHWIIFLDHQRDSMFQEKNHWTSYNKNNLSTTQANQLEHVSCHLNFERNFTQNKINNHNWSWRDPLSSVFFEGCYVLLYLDYWLKFGWLHPDFVHCFLASKRGCLKKILIFDNDSAPFQSLTYILQMM